jgi:hypothetical protein
MSLSITTIIAAIRRYCARLLGRQSKIGSLSYPDLGYSSALDYWHDRVLPNYRRYREVGNRENAIATAQTLWNLCEWSWHDVNPGQDTRGSNKYRRHTKRLFNACPELCLIQDIAEIDKHRGLSRPSVNVIEIVGAGSPGGTLFTSGPLGADQRTPESTLAIKTAMEKFTSLTTC